MKIVITGAAGLVGQNLVLRLKQLGHKELLGIDKHPANTRKLRELHPGLSVIEADLAKSGAWEEVFTDCDVLIQNHAQIGALTNDPFHANNIVASENVIAAAKAAHIPYMVHISSSVVHSAAKDFYTESKKIQEEIATQSGIPCCVLRPTLMFGWFDRKHLGWLARFMQKTPIFPIPGDGCYLRQPLYVGDFCNVVISAIERPHPGKQYDISGQTEIDYIDLMREVKSATSAHARILEIPYWLFKLLLQLYALVDRTPPFTTKQLAALVTPDVFDVIDWPGIFNVSPTPLREALVETFRHPVYSRIELAF